jgi:hypothetical protein
MSVRAKVKLTTVTEYIGGSRKLLFETQYDAAIPEDQRFCKATPFGQFEMHVDNPAAIEQFELGKSYYIDFSTAT